MTTLRAIAGLCMLCALLVSAFAAQSASAATNGTTGLAGGTPYSGAITVSGGETLIHSVLSGVEVEFKSTELTGSGEMESMLAETGEHTWHVLGIFHFQSVTVVKPKEKGCAVKNGTILIVFTASSAGWGMDWRVQPKEGTTLAKFEVEGCSIAALNGVYEVTGSVVGEPVGTEIKFTRAGTTGQKTLKLRGQNAGINGVVKLKTSGGTAIEAATVETP